MNKNKIFLMYSINSIIVSVFLILSLGFFISNSIKSHVINTHIKYYPYIVQDVFEDNKSLSDLLLKPENNTKSDNFFLKFFEMNDSVFKIKIWDKFGNIIWSNNKEIIEKEFPDNKNYKKALLGSPTYEIKPGKKEKNSKEIETGDIFEFYIPLYLSDKIIGVVEICEKNLLLTQELKKSRSIIWLIVITNIVIFYFLRLSIFLHADRRHNEVFDRLNQTQEVTVLTLAHQAELRDSYTGNHIIRTSEYAKLIGEKLKENNKFKNYITDIYIEDLRKAALLHDIGKVGISDALLNKPGKLTFEEFEEVKKHCKYGYETLLFAKDKLGFRTFLDLAMDIVRFHHEKWDGTGYPDGLKGEQIPLSARIMALSDVYDALRSERPYKKGFTHSKAVQMIKDKSGIQFDPVIVTVFLENHLEFKKISKEFADFKEIKKDNQ